MTPETFTILLFVGLLVGLLLGHPIAFVLGGLAVLFGYANSGTMVFSLIINRVYGIMDSYVLVAVPLFILMAQFLTQSGIAESMFETMRYLLGPIRGGISLTVIAISVILAATTGIIGASMATMGLLALPVLLEYGYQKELSCGVICAGGTLGILIPPSIMLVVLGAYASLSVGKLFAAAVIPGLILSGLYMLYTAVVCFFKPDWGPAIPPEERGTLSLGELSLQVLVSVVPPGVLIAGVLGSIFFGVATPTEAAGIGAFLTFVLMVIYGRFTWEGFYQSVIQTARTTTMVMVIVIGATAFTGVFISNGGMEVTSNFLLGLQLGKWGTYIVMMGIVFFLGMFIDWIGIVLIVLPLFVPIAQDMGFNKLWFVFMIGLILQTSFLTPPFGFALFYLKGVAPDEVSTNHIYRGVLPFIALMLVGVIICTVFPQTVLWLPQTLF